MVRRLIEISRRKIGKSIERVDVVSPAMLNAPDGTRLLIAVGAAGAREAILDQITLLGFLPGRDAWFVA